MEDLYAEHQEPVALSTDSPVIPDSSKSCNSGETCCAFELKRHPSSNRMSPSSRHATFSIFKHSNIVFIICITLVLTCLTADGNSERGNLSEPEQNPCLSRETCSACIISNGQCAWCRQDGYTHPRCDLPSKHEQNNCHSSQIYNPRHEITRQIDEELTINKTNNEEDAIQIKPQRVHLKIRPNSPYTLKVQFRQAVDYPVDLYYLMDLSKSMEDDKVKLAELGNLLANEMQKITTNFRLGFGSFVDKVVMPYVSIVPEK